MFTSTASSSKKHGDFKSTVFSADISHCPDLRGMFAKQNNMGLWQQRFMYLNNEFLVYKESEKSEELKGAVDLSDALTVSVKSNLATVIQ